MFVTDHLGVAIVFCVQAMLGRRSCPLRDRILRPYKVRMGRAASYGLHLFHKLPEIQPVPIC